MFYILLIFILTVANAAEKDQPCQTPDKKEGQCIPIDDCQSILHAITLKNDTAIQFAKQSQCGFYEQRPLVCCDKEEALTSSKYKKFLPSTEVCGIIDRRLLGGLITLLNEYPWMVVLEYKTKSTGEATKIRCAGSLINKRYVLTDVNCFSDEEFELTNVRLGEYNITTDPDCEPFTNACADPVRIVKVNKMVKHPDGHNIGLIRMENEIDYTDFIQPICLPRTYTSTARANSSLVAAGWGVLDDGSPTNVLLRLHTTKLSDDECKKELPEKRDADESCLKDDKNYANPCLANIGSPIMRELVDAKTYARYYQEGIFRTEKCDNTVTYTNVVNYMPWILDTISLE